MVIAGARPPAGLGTAPRPPRWDHATRKGRKRGGGASAEGGGFRVSLIYIHTYIHIQRYKKISEQRFKLNGSQSKPNPQSPRKAES